MPAGKGPLNEQGVDFYYALVDGLLERGITPFPTLYHWDLPLALEDEGGWVNRDTALRFADYAAAMFERLGDRVDLWLTHNEPWVTAFMAYVSGEKAPGLYNNWPLGVRVSHHLLLSHGLAVQALRGSSAASAKIGIAPNLHPTVPLTDSPEDAAAALLWDGFQNRWFLDPVFKGSYPEDVLAAYERFGIQEAIRGRRPGDHLEPDRSARRQLLPPRLDQARARLGFLDMKSVAVPSPFTEMGWEVTPEALHDLLVRLSATTATSTSTSPRTARPSRTSWDGGEVVEDPRRVDFISRHLEALARGDRRRREREGLLRLVAAGQLRVGEGLREALRPLLRRLSDAAAHSQAKRALVPRPDRSFSRGHFVARLRALRPARISRPIRAAPARIRRFTSKAGFQLTQPSRITTRPTGLALSQLQPPFAFSSPGSWRPHLRTAATGMIFTPSSSIGSP